MVTLLMTAPVFADDVWIIDIKGVCNVLKDADIKSSTLEIIGSEDILKKSVKYLKENGL